MDRIDAWSEQNLTDVSIPGNPSVLRTPDGRPNLTAPTPRTADGKPDLSGLWQSASVYVGNIAKDLNPGDVPFQPWAEALYKHRRATDSKDDPTANCVVGGVPPTITSLYNDPALFKNYPFHADILTALQQASVRPKTPAYQTISIVISHHVSPPAGISPVATEQAMVPEINNALVSKGVIP